MHLRRSFGDFQLRRSWRDIEQLINKSPKLSKEAAQWKKLVNFPRDQTNYSDVVSMTSLMEAGLLFSPGKSLYSYDW